MRFERQKEVWPSKSGGYNPDKWAAVSGSDDLTEQCFSKLRH